jgi:hypothetical protein
MRSNPKLIWALLMVAFPAGAFGQTLLPVIVSDDEARVTIELPGGIGAELTVAFEDVVGLHPASLDVSAELVSPLDFGILGRLPANVGVPASFPVLVRISPTASSLLSFSGVAKVSFYTHNLQLDPAVPLALFRAPSTDPPSPFDDIAVTEGRGSYRAGGSTGDFSEFLIVLDNRPIDAVISGKFNVLQARLTEHSASMPAGVVNTLQTLLTQARTLYDLGQPIPAMGQLKAFSQHVKARSGKDIPDVWRAHDPSAINVAGLLRSAADTLIFSLDRKTSR